MPLTNKRSLQDANARITQALPAAGATATSAALDLGTTTAFRIPGMEFLLAVPKTPGLANGKAITFTVQHSPDNGATAFAPVPGLAPMTVTGAGANGGPASPAGTGPFQFRLPLGLMRFVRVVAVADAASGDVTGVNFTFQPVF